MSVWHSIAYNTWSSLPTLMEKWVEEIVCFSLNPAIREEKVKTTHDYK